MGVMNSSEDILGMIATEAIEGDFRHPNMPERDPRKKDEGPTISMPLRLVREKDGTLKWED